jgi:hypothetical protein
MYASDAQRKSGSRTDSLPRQGLFQRQDSPIGNGSGCKLFPGQKVSLPGIALPVAMGSLIPTGRCVAKGETA